MINICKGLLGTEIFNLEVLGEIITHKHGKISKNLINSAQLGLSNFHLLKYNMSFNPFLTISYLTW